ncbi:MAG: DoxX family membrane protein [Bacteroidales bacterium]|nr:DoxX family membrane protein [Bacteroidales bacterium]
MKNKINYSKSQLIMLVILRVIIGWLFLYEGIVKLINPAWSSFGYLMDSQGFMSGFYKSIAANQGVLDIVDIMNIWGLIAIGLGLILGCFAKIAKIAGIVLLVMYYLSHPPFFGLEYNLPTEGNYLLVNKILVELFTLAVLLVFPTSKIIGFDRLIFKKKNKCF